MLYVVRHAKSSWDDPLLDDFSRPLNERGKRDAPRMGKLLKTKINLPDLILTSTARRALDTAKRMADPLGYAKEKVKGNPDLYHASAERMLAIVQTTKDKHTSLLLVGHNPGLTGFVNDLSNQQLDAIPTCGIAACKLDVDSWKDVDWKKGELIFYEYPKSLKD